MADFRKKLNPLIRWSVIFRFCWMNFSRNWPFRFQARTIQHVGRENWNLQEINCPRAGHSKWIKIGKIFFSSFFVFLISLSYFIVSLQQIKELETTEEVLLQLIEVEKVEILANQPPPPERAKMWAYFCQDCPLLHGYQRQTRGQHRRRRERTLTKTSAKIERAVTTGTQMPAPAPIKAATSAKMTPAPATTLLQMIRAWLF